MRQVLSMALTIAIKNDISEIPLSELLGSTTVSTPLSLDTSGTSTPTKYVRRTETQNVREKASHRKRSKIHVRNITIPVDIDFYGFNQSLDISSDSSDFQTEDSTQQVLSVRQMQEGNSVSYVDRSHYLLNINKLQRFQSMNSLFSEDYQLLASKRRFFSDIPRSKIPVRVKKLLPSVKKNHPIYEQIVPKIEYFPNSSEIYLRIPMSCKEEDILSKAVTRWKEILKKKNRYQEVLPLANPIDKSFVAENSVNLVNEITLTHDSSLAGSNTNRHKQLNDNAANSSNTRRYEEYPITMEKTSQMERTEPKKLNRKGRLVTFYRNGDPFSSGLIVSISQKSFPTLDSLLAWLNTKIVTTNGVNFIFSYPDGHEVKSVSDFRGGYLYVVSSTRMFNRNIKYGVCKEQQQMWSNKALTGENMKNGAANPNVVKGRSRHGSLGGQTQWRPRVITVISNTNRELRERLILNPKTTQNFEELPLWKGRPVKALYTIQPPYIKVESYSQLFRDFKDHHTFLACGEELPLELNNQALSESDSSGIDSVNGFHDIRIPKRAQIHGAALPSVPPINEDLSKNRNGVPKPFSDRPFAPRTGAVRVEILGQTREFYPPTVYDAIDDGSKPDKLLTLQWVYGYRGHDTRYNLLILPSTGELVYYVGTVVVIFDRVNGIQRHYMGHTEDITCLAMHPNQKWLATGQQAGNSTQQQFQAAHIRIWDSRMLNTYAIIGLGTMKVSVCSLGFSIQSNGDFLQAVDEHDLHVLRVWDWQNEKLIAQTTTTPYSVMWSGFHALDDTLLITVGRQHLYFWKLAWDPYRERQGRLLRDTRSGHFDDESTRILTCVCFSALGDVIVGDSTGAISVWTREDDDDDEDLFILNKYFSDNIRPKHKNAIFGMVTLQDGTLLTAAGRELKVWDTMDSFKLIKERVLPESIGNIRALVIQNPSSTDGVIYLGTTKGYIWEGFLQHKFTPVVQGHNQSVSAVTVIQGESAFVTVGVDHLVIKWSMENHNVTWKIMLEGPCTCVNIDPQGDMLIVGTSIGRLHIINTYDGLPITSLQISTEPISSLQFSPNESYLAAGSQDGKITVFKVLYDGQFYRKLGILDTFNIAVSHIDWSMDSRYIQSESTDHELQYWNVMELTKVKSARVMRDVDWASHTCTLAFTHLGAWSNLDSNEILTTVGCFTGKTTNYLCAGDNKGRLRLYKYPCSCYKAKFNEEKQCSSSLINIQTLDSNGGLLSSGTDASLMQWTIESDDDNI